MAEKRASSRPSAASCFAPICQQMAPEQGLTPCTTGIRIPNASVNAVLRGLCAVDGSDEGARSGLRVSKQRGDNEVQRSV